MGMTGVVMMGVGTGFSAMSQYNAGKAQQKVAEYNAQVGELQAQDALERGKVDEQRHRVQVKGMIGSQRAAWAASGVDVNDVDSNASQVTQDTAKFGELDALTIRMNAAREAWGYRVGAQNSRAQGELAAAEGRMGALGTIVSAGGKYAAARWGFGDTKAR